MINIHEEHFLSSSPARFLLSRGLVIWWYMYKERRVETYGNAWKPPNFLRPNAMHAIIPTENGK